MEGRAQSRTGEVSKGMRWENGGPSVLYVTPIGLSAGNQVQDPEC